MNLRTPRRRISPETKRRYRAIKGFFRRALGSSSQPDLQITSSIALNVTDLKQKILGIEQQLDEVNKHCRSIYTEGNSRTASQSPDLTSSRYDLRRESKLLSESQVNEIDTKILYKTPENKYNKISDESDCVRTNKYNIDTSNLVLCNEMRDFYDDQNRNTTKKNRKIESEGITYNVRPYNCNHKAKSMDENFVSAYSTSSYVSLNQFRDYCNPNYSNDTQGNNGLRENHYRNDSKALKLSKYERQCEERPHKKYARKQKHTRTSNELDQDFIADIIRRQYKPIKMFGKRESELSQFSVPVCRDRGFYFDTENCYQKDRHLCCGVRHHTKHAHDSDRSEIRSLCDTRLKRNPRIKNQKRYIHAFNDSDIHDLIPVKEKSSPKAHYPLPTQKEVPPSPRSHRPRLNLKSQYNMESDDNIDFEQLTGRKILPERLIHLDENTNFKQSQKAHHREYIDMPNFSMNDEIIKTQNTTMNSLQNVVDGNIAMLNNSFNQRQESITHLDKTDKALCEIKDILHTFLQEIKREASVENTKIKEEFTNTPPKTCDNFDYSHSCYNNCTTPHCPITPSPYNVQNFGSTCCYPIIPVCPLNCIQNSYTMPSTSFTCDNCASQHNEQSLKFDTTNNTLKNETDELVKEIYKFVSQSPPFIRNKAFSEEKGERKESTERVCNSIKPTFTSRSAGGSKLICKHDAKVGTIRPKYVSRSCEAIVPKMTSDMYNSDSTASYSDTVIQKFSAEATATQSTSETEPSTEYNDKEKLNKFAKVIKSLGLFKKSRKDVIEELSESESNVDIEAKDPPFPQEVTNYMMQGQEFYNPPPIPCRPEHLQNYQQPINSGISKHPISCSFASTRCPRMQQTTQSGQQHYDSRHATAPPLYNSYESYLQSQVPLCLKEIEVKSIGCQSERKLSFFKKITKKMNPIDVTRNEDVQKNCSTQTSQNKPGLFNWSKLPPKTLNQNDPFVYGYKAQKKLAEGDLKMRKAMLKKMFYKKNPFSPNNLIIKTLLGRDKSSFGDPPAMYRPRMFI